MIQIDPIVITLIHVTNFETLVRLTLYPNLVERIITTSNAYHALNH